MWEVSTTFWGGVVQDVLKERMFDPIVERPFLELIPNCFRCLLSILQPALKYSSVGTVAENRESKYFRLERPLPHL